MKNYDIIVIGSGSAMSIVERVLSEKKVKVAVIDKDEPGGICLTRGCIPSKIMLYPAELLAAIEGSDELGLDIQVRSVSYEKIMKRMRSLIDTEIDSIRKGLSSSDQIDFYNEAAEFVGPYTLKVRDELISGEKIILATGSRPHVPNIKNLERVGYHTSDSIIRMQMKRLPKSLVIIGGGYIAAEFGFFFSMLGCKVTVVGRNRQFLPDEEPEIASVARRALEKHMKINTGFEVFEALKKQNSKLLLARNIATNQVVEFEGEEILIAAGRAPNNDLLHLEKTGVKVNKEGWIETDEYMRSSKQNIWVVGDADGRYLFRHVANYEADIVYENAILGKNLKMDYHAVPHAVFTYPEVASVGMKEAEAVTKYGKQKILLGFERYEDTAKGEAMNAKEYFAKIVVHRDGLRILGAHIVGPNASILIQEVINLMNAGDQSIIPMFRSMHIHPALSEVVQRASGSLMEVDEYHHLLRHHLGYNY
jgi:mycothione reductase